MIDTAISQLGTWIADNHSTSPTPACRSSSTINCNVFGDMFSNWNGFQETHLNWFTAQCFLFTCNSRNLIDLWSKLFLWCKIMQDNVLQCVQKLKSTLNADSLQDLNWAEILLKLKTDRETKATLQAWLTIDIKVQCGVGGLERENGNSPLVPTSLLLLLLLHLLPASPSAQRSGSGTGPQ